MKKRFLAFLLAVCVAVSMLVLPASAVGSNAAVQTATALGGLTAEQAGSLGAPLNSFSVHSASLNPVITVLPSTINGRFTNMPLVASSCNCSSSLMVGSLSFNFISL